MGRFDSIKLIGNGLKKLRNVVSSLEGIQGSNPSRQLKLIKKALNSTDFKTLDRQLKDFARLNISDIDKTTKKGAKLALKIRDIRKIRSDASKAELEFMLAHPELGTLLKSGSREFSSAEAKAGLKDARMKVFNEAGFKLAPKKGFIRRHPFLTAAVGATGLTYLTPRAAVLAGDYYQDKDPRLAAKLYGFAPYMDLFLTFLAKGLGFGRGLMPKGAEEYLQEAIPAGIDPSNPTNVNLGWGYGNVPNNKVYLKNAKDVATLISLYGDNKDKLKEEIDKLTPEQKRRYAIAEGLRSQLGSVTIDKEDDNSYSIKDPYVWEPDDADKYQKQRVTNKIVDKVQAAAEQVARKAARYGFAARSSEDNTGYISKRNTTKAHKYRTDEEIAERKSQGVAIDENDNEYFEGQKLHFWQGVPVRRFKVNKKK